MIGDTTDITFNAVVKTLKKVNQDNFGAQYYLRDGTEEYTLKVEHVLPTKKNANLESHKISLTVDSFDAEDVLLTRQEMWTVLRTVQGRQPADALDYALGLAGWCDSTNLTKVLARES